MDEKSSSTLQKHDEDVSLKTRPIDIACFTKFNWVSNEEVYLNHRNGFRNPHFSPEYVFIALNNSEIRNICYFHDRMEL